MIREVRVRLDPADADALRRLRAALERESGKEVSGAAALRWALRNHAKVEEAK